MANNFQRLTIADRNRHPNEMGIAAQKVNKKVKHTNGLIAYLEIFIGWI
jgi:hypothetical protein